MSTLLGLSHNATLLVWTLIAIVFLIVLISKYKWNPFVTLLISALMLGLLAGMKPADVISSITGGLGGTLGTIAIVIGLGTMLGKMMAESGGAERIATTLVDRFVKRALGHDDCWVYRRYPCLLRSWRDSADSNHFHRCT